MPSIPCHEAAIKIGAVNRLNLIASALGPQRTVSELIPYVTQTPYIYIYIYVYIEREREKERKR